MSHSALFSGLGRSFNAKRALAWYMIVAGGAAALDASSKIVAVETLTASTVPLGRRFALMLVYNEGAVGGFSWGPYTWLINVCLTTVAVTMISVIVVHLAKVDRRASLALGLVAGGAAGNLASMLQGRDGVPDFLAIRFSESAVVCNVADLALWSGALLLVPVVRKLMRAIRVERAAKPQAAGSLVRA
ncbi:MAG: signal peptidase II [Gemmatimonadaceae bacterium]